MCHPFNESQKYFSQGKYDQNSIQKAMSRFSPGFCMDCGLPMAQQEMFPPGRMSRSMHDGCFSKMFNKIHTNCVVCGCRLTNQQINSQKRNWREPSDHICLNGDCHPAWILMHVCATGEIHKLLGQVQPQYAQPQYAQPQVGMTPVQQMLQQGAPGNPMPQYAYQSAPQYHDGGRSIGGGRSMGLPQHGQGAIKTEDYFYNSSHDPYAYARQGQKNRTFQSQGRTVHVIDPEEN